MTAPVLVTGATGLVGRHLVEALLAAGRTVRVLVRSAARLPRSFYGQVAVVEGELAGVTLAAALRGVDTVFHLAACARAWSRDPDEFTAVNVTAVCRLLRALEHARVRRLVHVSTVLTLPAAGTAPDAIPYVESKRQGERLVEAFAAAGGEAVIVHPTRIYGPGPLNDANGVTRMVAQYLRAPVVFRLADGDVLANYVHAADVADGLLRAAERGASGGHYVLGGENTSLRGLLDLVGRIAGRRRCTLALPRVAALAAAYAAVLWGAAGGTAFITPAWVRAYFSDQRVDIGPTCRALQYRPRTLAEGLEETIRWLRKPSQPAG